MRTILAQLVIDKTRPNRLREFFWADYQRRLAVARIAGLDPRKLTVLECEKLILELADSEPITILIDAIDSIDDPERHILIGSLKNIAANAGNVIKVLTA